jgi:hypothetical protein
MVDILVVCASLRLFPFILVFLLAPLSIATIQFTYILKQDSEIQKCVPLPTHLLHEVGEDADSATSFQLYHT